MNKLIAFVLVILAAIKSTPPPAVTVFPTVIIPKATAVLQVYIVPTATAQIYIEPTVTPQVYVEPVQVMLTLTPTMPALQEMPTLDGLVEWHPYVEETPVMLDLDSVWDMAPALALALRDCVYPLAAPFVTWDMAYRASNLQAGRANYEEVSIQASVVSVIMQEGGGYFPIDGNIRIAENDVFPILISTPGVLACRQPDGYPSVYGVGVQSFLNGLYNNHKE